MDQSRVIQKQKDVHSSSENLSSPPSEAQKRRTILKFGVSVLITSIIVTATIVLPFRSIALTCPLDAKKSNSRPALPPLTTGIDPLTEKPSSWFSGPCGRSPAAAHAANCSLDLVSFSWLPQACIGSSEREEEDEFLALRRWNFTHDVRKQDPITDLRALLESDAAPDRIYTSADWHYAHCAFMFRRLQRRFASGQHVDGYIASEGHARHCAAIITGARETWEHENGGALTATRVFVKYPQCV